MSRVLDNKNSRPLRFAFLLLPDFSLISFSSALEPLHKVNRVLGSNAYSSHLLSIDGEPACSSSSVHIHVEGELGNTADFIADFDVLFICGSSTDSADQRDNEGLASWLQQLSGTSVALGGIASGVNLLVSAGLLDGCRVTCDAPELERLHPEVIFTHNLFELDNQRYTSSGGTTSMDMMLALIGKQQGADLAVTVSELLVRDRRGSAITGKATMTANAVKTGPEPKLREALDLMLSNMEEPLGADELACHVGISRRQLERIFRKSLHTAPSKYYLQLRLEEARKLLRDDRVSIVQVALATGFSNASHFSTAYRNHFQVTPREERQRSRDNDMNELRHSLPV